MKTIQLYMNIIFICILQFSCSDSTSPEDPPPLGDLLFGTYLDVWADYQPDSTNHLIYSASSTDSTYLIINANGSYSMRLELYVEITDMILIVIQEGSYLIKETKYTEASGLTPAHWEGRLEFKPEGASFWGGKFWISSAYPKLIFNQLVFINIQNSVSRFLIYSWIR